VAINNKLLIYCHYIKKTLNNKIFISSSSFLMMLNTRLNRGLRSSYVTLYILLLVVISMVFVLAVETGFIGIIITLDYVNVSIHSPINTTYAFSIGSNYTLDLNVSSPHNISLWYYTLEDLKLAHNFSALGIKRGDFSISTHSPKSQRYICDCDDD